MADKIYELTTLERGTRKSKNDKTLTGLWVTFRNEQGKDRKEFFMDWKSPEVIAILEDAGINGKVTLDWEKTVYQGKERFDIVGAKKIAQGQSLPPSQPTPQAAEAAAGQAPAALSAAKDSPVMIRNRSLRMAIDFTLGLLNAPERFKNIYKPAKADPATLLIDTMAVAGKFQDYLEGKVEAAPKSDTADVDPKGVDVEQPDLPDTEPPQEPSQEPPMEEPDDDIPF